MGKKDKNPEPAPVVIVRPPAPVSCGGCRGTGRVGSQYHPQDHGACNGTGWVRV